MRGGRWLVNGETSQGLLCPSIAGEAIAHFTRRDSGPSEAEVGSSAYGNAHSSIDVSTNLRVDDFF
jgi:hypothetical protein